ncbi:Alpha/Beta hydrolase protein [Annulohypoxylon bovei var. microspora]|nr:Alpha/Beta hydrolase protein [Annulohypoxylon bovei var. microspora]
MRSIEKIRALSTIDPELDQLIKNGLVLPPSWNKDTNVYEVRALLSRIAETHKNELGHRFEEKDLQIPTGDSASITVRVHRLKEQTKEDGGHPGMLMLHGGGYSIGDLNTGARLSRVFVGLGGVAVNVDFRLSPEHPFPGPVEDAFDALTWVAKNLKSLGIDPAKGFIVAGESSGANMALAVAYLWTIRRKGAALQITGIYSSANSAATIETVPEEYKPFFMSMEQNAHAPVLDMAAVERIKELYKPDPKSPLAYPIAIPDPSIMPRAYFQACGLDPTRDCTLVMEQVWKDAGVQAKLDIYSGMPHVFWALGLPALEQIKKHEADTRDGLLWLLKVKAF